MFSLASDTVLCGPVGNISIKGPAGFDSYLWSTNETSQNIVANTSTTYRCTATVLVGDKVTNGSFTNGNSGFVSTYTYSPSGVLGATLYTITTNPGLQNGSWAQSFVDHTSGSGNMLAVDGTGVSIVWSQNISVLPNTDYDFSAWAATVGIGSSDINRARLQFSINNVLIGNIYQCGSPGVWGNFSAQWNSGANTNALIQITDQEAIPFGNDFALDDISFTSTCSHTDSIKVDFANFDVANIKANQGPFCVTQSPSTLLLDANAHSGIWSGDGINGGGLFSPSLVNTDSSVISYTTDGICTITDTVHVHLRDVTKANISAFGPLCESANQVTMQGDQAGIWTINGSASNGVFDPKILTAGVHEVILHVNTFCVLGDTLQVTVTNDDVANINANQGPFCVTQSPSTLLLDANAHSGIWSGDGINGSGLFSPSLVNNDSTVISYTTDGICTITDTVHVHLRDVTKANISAFGPLCESESRVSMHSDQAGTWTINGSASNGVFDPKILTASVHEVILQVNTLCLVGDTLQVEVKSAPKTIFSADTLWGCAPLHVEFSDLSAAAISSKWYFNLNGNSVDSSTNELKAQHDFFAPGCYDVVLQNTYALNCTSEAQLGEQICVKALPVANFSWQDLPMTVAEPQVHFLNTSANANSYLWTMKEGDPESINDIDPWTQYNTLTQDTFPVTLIAKNEWCADTISKKIVIKDISTVFVPSAFSPNEDDVNDFFVPTGIYISIEKYEFSVYDKWGELIFYSNQPNQGWNGKRNNNMHDAQVDVYVWKLNVVNATSKNCDVLFGAVTLLR